jgi:hypothetical protein
LGYSEPATVEGDDAVRLLAFERVFAALGERVRQFMLIASRQRSAVPG